MEKRVFEAMRLHFKPEFLNRVDETIIFHSLEKEHLIKIVGLQIDLLRKRVEDNGYKLDVDDSVIEWIAEVGYDPAYGARPVKRAIQRYIEDPLALRILEGAFSEDDVIKIRLDENKVIVFEKA
jgi:ATP-dependent Clp protease ATP-binding subunit ClpB